MFICCLLIVSAALDAAGCEKISVKSGDKPNAIIWHVFRPQDADRIRSFVDKVGVDRINEVIGNY